MWDKKERKQQTLSDLVKQGKEEQTRLNVEIPESLHYELKMYALKSKKKVREVVIEAVKEKIQ